MNKTNSLVPETNKQSHNPIVKANGRENNGLLDNEIIDLNVKKVKLNTIYQVCLTLLLALLFH